MSKLIPKKQTAWGKLEYKGPQYSQVVEQMKKEDPQAYNRLQVANARSQQSNSEVVRWTDAEGDQRTSTTNIGMSSADPMGQLYVEGVVLNPVFKGLGRVAEYGLAKAGNKWAKAKIINRQMQNISTPNKTIPNNVGWAPKQTIGDVKNRSRLSYDADNMGADGLIYNDIYDNGYNHNQVILSFKKMNQPKQTTINHSKSPVQLDLDFRYPLTEGDNKIQKVFSSLIMRGKMPGTSGMRVTPLETVGTEVSNIMNNHVFSRLHTAPPQDFYSNIYQGSRGLMQNYNPRTIGINFPKERIVIKEGIPQVSVLPHELRHRLDDIYPLPDEQQQILNKAYSNDFNSDKIKKAAGLDSSYDMSKEAVTTNLDSRIYVVNKHDPKYYLSAKYQNELIDDLLDREIVDAVSNSNGYGQAYIDYLKRNNLLTKDKVKAFRDAMKYVGGLSTPIMIKSNQK